jgi:hypothetical protein
MKFFRLFVEMFVALFLVGALLSLPVMLLWDWLMPTIFGLPEITWFQAWGLLWLTGILFRPSVSRKD